MNSRMIAANIQKVRERIFTAAARVSRDPGKIILVCVTKGRSIEEIKQVVSCGLVNIGENRLQEAFVKHSQLSDYKDLHWQMIGHLQSNKVKKAVQIFDLIHSVDSLDLAQEIDRQAVRINKVQDILIEVKTSPEKNKLGIAAEIALKLVQQAQALTNIRVKGLMTVAPLTGQASDARPYFRQLRKILEEINQTLASAGKLTDLSMGMSDDFEIAVEEGATILRIGRAIFA